MSQESLLKPAATGTFELALAQVSWLGLEGAPGGERWRLAYFGQKLEFFKDRKTQQQKNLQPFVAWEREPGCGHWRSVWTDAETVLYCYDCSPEQEKGTKSRASLTVAPEPYHRDKVDACLTLVAERLLPPLEVAVKSYLYSEELLTLTKAMRSLARDTKGFVDFSSLLEAPRG